MGNREAKKVEDLCQRAGIVYATPDGTELKGDFYSPNAAGPFPVVVAVPGGGWIASERRSLSNWGAHLARSGIAVFVIEYRTARTTKMYPEAVCDVVSAIQYVRGAAQELNIDPARIALMGTSAGAHLGALAALAGSKPHFKSIRPANNFGDISPEVKAFLGIYGVYDLYMHWQQEIAYAPNPEDRRSERFSGANPYDFRLLYFDASPLSHVCHAANKMPIFLSYGTEDSVVDPQTQTIPFARALSQAGFMVRIQPVIGATHFWFSEEKFEEPDGSIHIIQPHIVRFLRRHL
ncbi:MULTISPECIES: alpha/beta hydrolase [Rhizobium/Agrobacterium group]|uniref:alpha/beta hydrolase n=1 Tax=Rhizobium/Agrobacterium group TaxID=227290 RepID=UPI00107F185B|nr:MULTISPECIES: alpha/beta hydrolase [Rhizobium/Agrobacterium group]MBB4403172.1 acetyl esterase/lipase [Agrobacterium radiobacter]MBB5588918.1 acetyl esterase/lipase [Agrobacterium radiobacter]TGE86513.1 peptidase [Rhizobium sp. SEMIA 4032]